MGAGGMTPAQQALKLEMIASLTRPEIVGWRREIAQQDDRPFQGEIAALAARERMLGVQPRKNEAGRVGVGSADPALEHRDPTRRHPMSRLGQYTDSALVNNPQKHEDVVQSIGEAVLA
jgi:hypothetical protein